MTTKPRYVSMQLTEPTRERLQRAQLNLSAAVGRKLTLSELVTAALDVAEADLPKLTAALTRPNGAPS